MTGNHDVVRSAPGDGGQFTFQVERILQSDALRHSDVLRRLLKFLAEKSISGEADQLKEYTVAVDALGKPSTYDPRHDSTVRIQMGRLRQKLAEYYRTEGKDDVIVVDLPKGRFKLSCLPHVAEGPDIIKSAEVAPLRKALVLEKWMWMGGLMWLVLLVITWLLFGSHYGRIQVASATNGAEWSDDLRELWGPFLAGNRPLIIAVADPLFVDLSSNGERVICRDSSLNSWEQVQNSPILAMRNALDHPSLQPSHYYASFGEVSASFQLGRLLGTRVRNISLTRMSEISQQQLADNELIVVGGGVQSEDLLKGVPIQRQLKVNPGGIEDLNPNRGEPNEYFDPAGAYDPSDGEAYALVSHVPGPLGSGDLQVFESIHAIGYVGAVRWFTDPAFAGTVITELKRFSGTLPRYYQVLLRVQFKDQVPTKTSWVLGRELHQ